MDYLEYFWSKVRKTESCWFWTGPKNKLGYGKLVFLPYCPTQYAHRLSWIIRFGDIEKGKLVLHTCDVPYCVNPEHLFLGTQKDNILDKVKKGRCNQKHENNNAAKLKFHEVKDIRESYNRGDYSQKQLALIYKVHPSTIFGIINNITWRVDNAT